MRTFCATLLLLFMSIIQLHAAHIDTLDVYSTSMQKFVRNLVLLPSTYAQQPEAHYPVVYLLHGWSGNYSGWLAEAPQLPDLADAYQCIFVFPDGGYDSWYLDSKIDTNVRYETYMLKELIPYIDSQYRTESSRSARAICGLSMGGHGALYLSLRHPEVFCAAGSMCGGVDLRPWKKNDWDLEGVLGDPRTHWKNWEDAPVVVLISQINPQNAPKIIVDCGNEDFFLPVNRLLRKQLLDYGIAHEYTERPGQHDAFYWCNAVDSQLLFIAKAFGRR